MKHFSLENKIAIVTGGGSGLGLCTVKRFLEAGAVVTMADINEDAGQLAEALGCGFVKTDVSDEKSVESLIQSVHEQYGRLDILVNNAGIIMPEQLLENAVLEDYQKLFAVNVYGVVNGLKYGARYISDGGVILNTASNSANGDYAGYGAYIASKCAVVGLTKAAAVELAHRNVRVNCICPNTIDTPMAYAEGCETELAVMKVTAPLARMCKPEEAAALYHFLASDDCKYITGEDIYIDGGLKAGPSTQLIDCILKGLKEA